MFKKSLIHLLSIGYALCLAVASLVEINTEAAFSIKHQDKIFHPIELIAKAYGIKEIGNEKYSLSKIQN